MTNKRSHEQFGTNTMPSVSESPVPRLRLAALKQPPPPPAAAAAPPGLPPHCLADGQPPRDLWRSLLDLEHDICYNNTNHGSALVGTAPGFGGTLSFCRHLRSLFGGRCRVGRLL